MHNYMAALRSKQQASRSLSGHVSLGMAIYHPSPLLRCPSGLFPPLSIRPSICLLGHVVGLWWWNRIRTMSRVTLPPVVPLLVLSGLYLISLGCGGLPSGKLPLPAPTNASAGAVSVSISPQTAALGAGNSLQFTATSSGPPTADLEWLADGVPGGNSASGTISRSGLYTAPQQVTSNAGIVIAVSE